MSAVLATKRLPLTVNVFELSGVPIETKLSLTALNICIPSLPSLDVTSL